MSQPMSTYTGNQLTVEDDFIIQCLRLLVDITTTQQELIVAAAVNINCDELLLRANLLKLSPAIYHAITLVTDHQSNQLNKLERVLLPEYIKNNIINSKTYQLLDKLLLVCHQQNIEVILFKGIYLAKYVYDDIAIRTMSDFDLLVKEDDLETLKQILINLGFRYSHPIYQKYRQEHFHLCPFYHPQSLHTAEVHWDLINDSNSCRVDIPGIWDRKNALNDLPNNSFTMSIEDFILHLVMHLSYVDKLKGNGLRSLCDVALVITKHKDEINWQTVKDGAVSMNMFNQLYLTLCLIVKIYGVSLDSNNVCYVMPKGFCPDILLEATNRVLLRKYKSLISYGTLALSRQTGIRNKLAIITDHFTRSNIAKFFSLDSRSWRVYIYAVARAFILLRQYGRSFFSYIFGKKEVTMQISRMNKLDKWLQD